MSWAGKKAIKRVFGSLFHKEQAPSDSAPETDSTVKPLTELQRSRIEKKLDKWQEEKGYRLPDRTVAESSARIGTNSILLYRYFAEKGTDFRTWRSLLRIRDAKEELLAHPEDSISIIARRVGIVDRSNFSRQFKAVVGDSPDNWRKNQK